jgi:hypothetical protein
LEDLLTELVANNNNKNCWLLHEVGADPELARRLTPLCREAMALLGGKQQQNSPNLGNLLAELALRVHT